jgi:hypothetical protein
LKERIRVDGASSTTVPAVPSYSTRAKGKEVEVDTAACRMIVPTALIHQVVSHSAARLHRLRWQSTAAYSLSAHTAHPVPLQRADTKYHCLCRCITIHDRFQVVGGQTPYRPVSGVREVRSPSFDTSAFNQFAPFDLQCTTDLSLTFVAPANSTMSCYLIHKSRCSLLTA